MVLAVIVSLAAFAIWVGMAYLFFRAYDFASALRLNFAVLMRLLTSTVLRWFMEYEDDLTWGEFFWVLLFYGLTFVLIIGTGILNTYFLET